jgi:hypothetical protein
MHDSVLLKLAPGRKEGESLPRPSYPAEAARIFGKVPVALDEPNVLLLDLAEYAPPSSARLFKKILYNKPRGDF